MSTSQMLKGILEGCLLAIISEGEIYGYEMSEKLAKYGFTMASEGKSVEDIFGSSPKEYANELVKVMERDRQETCKQIGFTVMNIVSFWIIASILIVNHGMLQISLIQCIGYSFSFILVVIGPNFLLRKMTL